MCYNVRKPSGNIPQPNWMAPEPNPQNLQAPLIPKPGHFIPAVCEQRLQLAAYGASIYYSIGRDINTGMLNRERLREFKKHQDMVRITQNRRLCLISPKHSPSKNSLTNSLLISENYWGLPKWLYHTSLEKTILLHNFHR